MHCGYLHKCGDASQLPLRPSATPPENEQLVTSTLRVVATNLFFSPSTQIHQYSLGTKMSFRAYPGPPRLCGGMAPLRSAWEPWMSPRHPAELRDPAPVFCTGWHSPGPQGCIAAPPLCGDTSWLPLLRGCIVAASALAGMHHGYLRLPTYCIICNTLLH